MPDLTYFFSFDWLEGSRSFDIAIGALTSAACFSLALPILYWCLPASRKWLFTASTDRRQILQAAFGVLTMSMAFANALCRFIPHRRLGVVHPVFFITTLVLVAIIGPRVLRLARNSKPAPAPARRGALAALSAALVTLVVVPIGAVVQAFW